MQRGHLRDSSVDVGGVGIGHRLDHDRRFAADQDGPDRYADRSAARQRGGKIAGHGRAPVWNYRYCRVGEAA
jgi:hypothetical protein